MGKVKLHYYCLLLQWTDLAIITTQLVLSATYQSLSDDLYEA